MNFSYYFKSFTNLFKYSLFSYRVVFFQDLAIYRHLSLLTLFTLSGIYNPISLQAILSSVQCLDFDNSLFPFAAKQFLHYHFTLDPIINNVLEGDFRAYYEITFLPPAFSNNITVYQF